MTGCSTDGISLFILNVLELLIKDSFIPAWTTPSVLASWADAMSFILRLAITCRKITFWNIVILKKVLVFPWFCFLFFFFLSSFKCHVFLKLFFVSYIQLRWQCCILLSRRFSLTHTNVSQIWCFSEMSTPKECKNHHGTVLSGELQSSQRETPSQFQEKVHQVRPHSPPFDSYSVTIFYPTYVFI